ncbi:hypothetical protein Pan258_32180 [Symmachiella dynata]|nr:hypothetical protein Pan258_32180 [Symmachiella dynata]
MRVADSGAWFTFLKCLRKLRTTISKSNGVGTINSRPRKASASYQCYRTVTPDSIDLFPIEAFSDRLTRCRHLTRDASDRLIHPHRGRKPI